MDTTTAPSSSPAPPAPNAPPEHTTGPASLWDRMSDYRGLFAFLLVFVLGCFITPKDARTGLPIFLSWGTQWDILFEYCEYGLLATGMTLVILTGGIDLSVGSVLGFCATLFALLTIGYGWGVGAAVVAVILAGLAAGAISGVLTARFRMQPFIATLVMMIAARGAARWLSGSIKVEPAAQPWYKMQHGTPAFFDWMTSTLPGTPIRPAVLVFLVAIAVTGVAVARTRFGRQLYAIGGNEEASRLSGIQVGQVKVIAYALCAGFAAIAGILNACRLDLGSPESGATYELDAIAAVVIGGTNLMGGSGGMAFTFVGVLIMAYINKILSLKAVPLPQRMVVQAAIIAVAVLIQRKKKGQP